MPPMPSDSNGSTGNRIKRRAVLGTLGAGIAGLAGCSGGGGGGSESGGSDSGGSDSGGSSGGSSDSGESGSSGGTTTGSSESNELADELTVLTWGGTYGDAHKKTIIKNFEDEFGVTVNHGVFGNDFDALAKQKAGGGGKIDVIEPGMTGAMTGVKQDLFHTLRTENIPNLDALKKKFAVDNLTYDPGSDPHIVPWVWGTAGLVHNTNKVSDPPTVWSDLFTDKTKGKVAMNTVAWLELGPVEHAAFALDIDITDFSSNFDQKLDKIFGKIKEWNDYMLQWFDSGSTMQQLLKNESAIAGVYWYGRYLAAKEAGAPIEFKIPDNGTSMWIDNWAIAKGTKHRYTAEKFLNYSLTQEAHNAFSAEFPYASPIELDNPPEALKKSPVPDNEDRIDMADLETIYDRRKDIQKRFQTIVRG